MSHPRLAAVRLAARLIALPLGVIAIGGCTVELTVAPDSGGGEGSSSDSIEGKLSNNGLALSPEALLLLEPTPIGRWDGKVALASGGALGQLATHPAGLEHIEYLALCALDQGSSLEIQVEGELHRLPGLFGLAPGWVSDGCEGSCQRWVSACLLAHANAYGLAVTVSMRGEHPGLAWDPGIEAEFTLQEAAFYGNVFALAGTSAATRPLYACGGRALFGVAADAERSWDYLQRRICGAGSNCGLQNAGPCHFSIAAGSACRGDAGPRGFYRDCLGEDLSAPLAPAPVYPEAITTYLVP
jgi:hypothetical protein